MTTRTHTPPETIERITTLARRGISGRQIANELSMPFSTVSTIISRAGLARPRGRHGTTRKKSEPRASKTAPPDYSSALYVKAPAFDPPTHLVRNSLMTERYVPKELDYRGRQ